MARGGPRRDEIVEDGGREEREARVMKVLEMPVEELLRNARTRSRLSKRLPFDALEKEI